MFIITTLQSRALLCLPGKAGKEMTLNRVCETFCILQVAFLTIPPSLFVFAQAVELVRPCFACWCSHVHALLLGHRTHCLHTFATIQTSLLKRITDITVAKYMAKEFIFLVFELALDTWIRSQLSAE